MKTIEIITDLPPPGTIPAGEILREHLAALEALLRGVPPGAMVVRRGRGLVAGMAAAAALAGWAHAAVYRTELGPAEEATIVAEGLPALVPGARVIARVFRAEAEGIVARLGVGRDGLRILLEEPEGPPGRRQAVWVDARDLRSIRIGIPPIPPGLENLLEIREAGGEVRVIVRLPPPGAFARRELADAAWALLAAHVAGRPTAFWGRPVRLAGERVEAGVAQAVAFTAARAGASEIRMAPPDLGEVRIARPQGVGLWPGDPLEVPGLGPGTVEAVGPGRRGLRVLVRVGRRSVWTDWP